MHNHLGRKYSQEEADRIAREQEKAAVRQERRQHYYGRDSGNNQYKRRPQIYLFQPDDLNNEDVILAIENTPTYKRTRQQLEDIRKQASGKPVKEEDRKSTRLNSSHANISYAVF